MLLFVKKCFWCPSMAINVSVDYSCSITVGFSATLYYLLTQCYYDRGARLNAMKRFWFLQPMIPPKRFDIFSPVWDVQV